MTTGDQQLDVIMGKPDRIQGKALGTAFGVVAAIPVAVLDPPAGALVAVGAVAFITVDGRGENGACRRWAGLPAWRA